MIIIILAIILILIGSIYAFMRQPKFGSIPSGKRLERIKQSPNYKNGAFQNISHTPQLTEGVSFLTVFREFFFEGSKEKIPAQEIAAQKKDIHNLNPKEDVLIWFGHSSYFMQIDSKRILVDPVLSGAATPMPVGTKAFAGTDIYKPNDIPAIDYLFLTHDHWDHLDYTTIKSLKDKVQKVFCPLGVGAHLERWGYDMNKVFESDWNDKIDLENGFVIYTTPARHFSGRGFIRNKTLWASFVLKAPSLQIYIGGDSGYDNHFKEIGEKFGSFDLAILENGQYNKNWRYIHLLPEEFHKAARDLNAKRILPVHSGKFALSMHSWDEPLKVITEINKKENLNIITPKIGEAVYLKDLNQRFDNWWENSK